MKLIKTTEARKKAVNDLQAKRSPDLEWINDVLHNDENSSDAELIDYFVENGLSLSEAQRFVSQRAACRLDMFYWVS